MGEGSIYDNETRGYSMSTLTELEDYLLRKDGDVGYLLNSDNNGKTVMLSGAWGSGKTHFWQNGIEPELSTKLKEDNKACVYVSLYGKDNIEVIKSEILQKAYSEIKEENIKQTKAISAFGMGTKILAGISIFGVKVDAQDISDGTKNHYDMKKIEDATEFLSDGGLICFDDFERKSKKIDLNDLFGFISQLAIDMKCKVVIILNSDVFECDEANVFKTVKEKTVNKFFYFEPTIKELFDSVYSCNEKYKRLDKYRDEILSVIHETEELNARIYIQVLDNCLEWVDNRDNHDIFRELVLCTIFFTNHHYSLGFKKTEIVDKAYDIYDAFLENIEISQMIRRVFPQYIEGNTFDTKNIIHSLKEDVTKKKADSNDNEHAEVYYTSGYKLVEENKYMLRDFYHFIYILKVENEIDNNLFNEINTFVKTGILLKKDEEQ